MCFLSLSFPFMEFLENKKSVEYFQPTHTHRAYSLYALCVCVLV